MAAEVWTAALQKWNCLSATEWQDGVSPEFLLSLVRWFKTRTFAAMIVAASLRLFLQNSARSALSQQPLHWSVVKWFAEVQLTWFFEEVKKERKKEREIKKTETFTPRILSPRGDSLLRPPSITLSLFIDRTNVSVWKATCAHLPSSVTTTVCGSRVVLSLWLI